MKDIERVAKILKNIGETSSTKSKESIISNHSDDKVLKDVLYFIFNPYIKTNISTKKYNKEVDTTNQDLLNIYEYMDYLSKSTGTNKNIETVKSFVKRCVDLTESKEIVEWLLVGIACKNLKIGVNSTTINKALGKSFIPKFDIMLAEKWVDYDKKKGIEIENWREYEGKEVIATLKIDGNRAEAFVREDGTVKILSREGNVIDGCVDIENALSKLKKGYVYEGEILAFNDEELNANELFKKTSSILRSKGVKKGLEFIIFDIIPIDKFEDEGFYDEPCVSRKAYVKEIINDMNDSIFLRHLEPMYVGEFDKELLDNFADQMKDNGEEGIMVQLAKAPYESKRTKNILKYKTFESADIRCVDVYEGIAGKNIGRLGGIICDYKGSLVKVGIGFSEQQREDYWKNPSEIVGKIVEVKYFEEFVKEDDSYDLRFASFKDIRLDKTKESYY